MPRPPAPRVEQLFAERPDQLKARVNAAVEEVLQANMTEALGALLYVQGVSMRRSSPLFMFVRSIAR